MGLGLWTWDIRRAIQLLHHIDQAEKAYRE